MDRVAKLAAEARKLVKLERTCARDELGEARRIVRFVLASKAFGFGFADNEISAAVDEALTTAATTP